MNMYTSEVNEISEKIVKALKIYGHITTAQGMKMFGLNETNTRTAFKATIRKRLATNCEGRDAIRLNTIGTATYNIKVEKALDLLLALSENNEEIDFWQGIKQTEDEPFILCCPTSDDMLDIVYIEAGKEKMMNNKLKRLKIESNYLVIIEEEEQMAALDFEGIKGFYLVKEDGGLVNVG